MAQVQPITDSYIDEVIKAANPSNPLINKTQGANLRELIKLLRDRIEQESEGGGLPAGGVAGEVLAKVDGADFHVQWSSLPGKADLVDGKVPLSQLPGISNGVVSKTYQDLTAMMTAGTLMPGSFYRISDFQTIHTIPNAVPAAINTGPIEPLLVLAVSASKLAVQAWSEQYPEDVIYYTTGNIISGASKGVITRRIDTKVNVDICNDFRQVKFRRWKLNPAPWNANVAYTRHQTVQYTDGAIYYCNKASLPAGDIPSLDSDNWVQFFNNNNYYYGRTNTQVSQTMTGQVNGTPSPVVPCDPANFIDVTMFQDYDNSVPGRYFEIMLKGTAGMLHNLVVFRGAATTYVMSKVYIGYYSDSLPQNTTIIIDTGFMSTCNFALGFVNSLVFLKGSYISQWNATGWVYGTTINTELMTRVSCGFTYSLVRRFFAYVNVEKINYCVMPALVHDFHYPGAFGTLKFSTNASIYNTTFVTNMGAFYNNLTAQPSLNSVDALVDVTSPFINKTFIGNVPISPNNDLARAYRAVIDRAQYCRTIFVGETQPAEKTVVSITNGTAKVIAWQNDHTPFPGDYSYIAVGDGAGVATFYSRHGNDFQIVQKDLIGGVWTPNSQVNYTIDALDGNGNVSQVTLHPNTAATGTRFIIV